MSQSSNGVAEAYARTGELNESERHELLSSSRRRITMTVLSGLGAHVQLDDLAAEVADRESGDAVNPDTVDRVALTLHHNHLPKMDELGILDYDHEANRIDC